MEAPILKISSGSLMTPIDFRTITSPISTLPSDLLKMIFTQLSLKDKIQCILTCKRWKIILRAHYHKAQFEARVNVLKSFVSSYNLQSGLDLLNRAEDFLKNPEIDKFSKLEIPRQTSRLKVTIEKILHINKAQGDQLLVEIQQFLEKEARILQLSAFYMKHTRFHLNTQDPIEFQAYRDCLFPILKPVLSGQPTDLWSILLNEEDPLVINLYSEAAFRYSGDRHQKIRYDIESILPYDHLEVFFHYLLPLAKNMRKLEFSTMSKTLPSYNWNSGKALKMIQKGLVEAPALEELCFSKLKTPLDESNAIALAEIITLRHLNRPLFPFKTISFGPETITQKGLNSFIQALKSYPLPLIIYVSDHGNIDNIFSPSTIPLFLLNRQLRLRFYPGDQLKKIIFLYHPVRQYILSCHISNAEKIESLKKTR